MIQVFHENGDLAAYRAWALANLGGYVLNRHWFNGAFGGKIHRVTCHWIQDFILLGAANPLSDHRYKACSDDLVALATWGTYAHQGAPHNPPEPCECI